MKARTTLLAAVLVLIGLPALIALIAAASSYVRNRNNGTLVSSGRERRYLLYVPSTYDPAKPTPLVISMHGAGGWPAQQIRLSGWNDLAEKERFIVVYPAGERGGPRIWHVAPGEALTRDVRFISDLIDALQAKYNIDRDRIYANGLSNGGGMSFVLSCRLADRIAAVGVVAAAQTLPWRWCKERRAVPMIAFHGTADPITPYRGGMTWISERSFPSVPIWIANWARRNGCAPTAIESAIAPDVTRVEYPRCTGDASVVLYKIRGGGHTWPGDTGPGHEPLPEWLLGRTTASIDATRETWAFFRAHPRQH